jgi:hypothetical protein
MTNDASESNNLGHIDIAALSAGVVAVSVSLFVAPGDYTLMNLIVSIVLIVTIFSFLWGRTRQVTLQQLAVASVLGFASVPAIGFIAEVAQSPVPLHQFLGDHKAWKCPPHGEDPCTPAGEHESRVEAWQVALGWLVVATVVFFVEMMPKRRRRRGESRAEISRRRASR